jgi:hypothetical protein
VLTLAPSGCCIDHAARIEATEDIALHVGSGKNHHADAGADGSPLCKVPSTMMRASFAFASVMRQPGAIERTWWTSCSAERGRKKALT